MQLGAKFSLKKQNCTKTNIQSIKLKIFKNLIITIHNIL
jgi:hypothetical protein